MPAEKESLSLYNGKYLIDFYPNSHRYKLQGEKTYLISVTAATGMKDKSQQLIKWAVGLTRDKLVELLQQGVVISNQEIIEACMRHEQEKEKALSIGDMVHDYAEQFARAKVDGTPVPQIDASWPNQVVNGIIAFLDWVKDHKVKFIQAERMVFSPTHGYVGRFDILAEVDGKLSIVDYKTSKGIYGEYCYQVAGYWLAVKEEDGIAPEQCLVIRFDKEGAAFNPETDIKLVDGVFLEEMCEGFLALLKIKEQDKRLFAYKSN